MRLCVRAVSSFLYSSLGLALKACTTVIKGKHCPVSMATSVATGIKGCVTITWSVRLTRGTVLLSDLQAVFIY